MTNVALRSERVDGFVRRTGALGVFIMVVCAAFLLAYGGLDLWSGDGYYGPRYLIPVIPLFAATLAHYVDTATHEGRLRSRMLLLVGANAVGTVIQVIGMTTANWGYFQAFYEHKIAGIGPRTTYESLHFNPEFSAVIAKLYFLLSWLHSFFYGTGLIWHVRDHAGQPVAIDLTPYTELDYWPRWFEYHGAFRAVPALAAVVPLIGIALAGLILVCARRLWTDARLEYRELLGKPVGREPLPSFVHGDLTRQANGRHADVTDAASQARS